VTVDTTPAMLARLAVLHDSEIDCLIALDDERAILNECEGRITSRGGELRAVRQEIQLIVQKLALAGCAA
jgi:hypothetical protein